MSKHEGAVAAPLYEQKNDSGSVVCTMTQDGDKVTIVIDLSQEGLSITKTGKSMLLANASVAAASAKHGTVRVGLNVYTKLTAAYVIAHEAHIIAQAKAKGEVSPDADTDKAKSILAQASELRKPGADAS